MVIPCYNEAVSIAATILEIQRISDSIEIWVVDNNSSDGTGTIAQNLGVRVLNCPIRGKGYAVRQAFSQIKDDFDVIFMVDGDHTYDVSNLEVGFQLVFSEGIDMVIGRRVPIHSHGDKRTKLYRPGHAAGNQSLSFLFSKLFKIDISDTLSGWRCFSPGFVRSFSGGASGFELETELNAHLFLIKGSAKSIDVGYRGRLHGSDSKLNTYKDGIKILRRMYFLFRTERPMFAFTLLGVPWFISSLILIRNVLERYFTTNEIPNFPSLIAGVGGFTVSVLLWATGLILENVRVQRVQHARFQYASISRSNHEG